MSARFAHGIFWTLTGTVAVRVFSFIVGVFSARLLGIVGFGELGMIQSTIGLLGTFAGFALGMTTTKYVAELKSKDPARTGRIIALSNLTALVSGGFMMGICYLAAPWLAQDTLNAPHLTPLLQVGAPLLLVSAYQGVQVGTLSGFQAFRTMARIGWLLGLVTLPMTISLIYFLGLLGAVLSQIGSTLCGIVLSSFALRREYQNAAIHLDLRKCWIERRLLWKYSIPAVLSGAMVSPVTWVANTILVNQPKGYAELGLFNAASQFRNIILFIPAILGAVTVPLLSEIHGQGDREHFARVVNLNLRTIWSLTLPLGFLAIALSSSLIGIYGPQYQDGRIILGVMVSTSILIVANDTIGQALAGSGKMWIGFWMNCGWAVSLIIAVILLVPSLGALGMALAYCMAYFLHTVWVIYYSTIKFGRSCLHAVPWLFTLTGLSLLLVGGIGKLPDYLFILTSFVLTVSSISLFWILLPVQHRESIKQAIRV